ncbi:MULTISPECIES: metal-dependent hydrolase [Nocardiaceae]|uniref:metal-dependent hydrolase n=1 Tax=Nocardiaceae TaxID=85025 RepID=UPI001E2E173B|nr:MULTISPECIES: metal-dependent hydrolase [Rhodococcus]MCC8927526.1 metal-dependent hydrolase [Rhodococcus sp. I2R]MCZ4275944.1 metal-dependent hydrolase [Rhodococcus yunnanensis]
MSSSEDTVDSADDRVLLHARNVSFDWRSLPLHYVDGDPLATHLMNVMHLLLPEGEEWFVRTFKEALPLIDDESLREDVIGFIGQEAMHAQAHTEVHEQLRAHGIDVDPFVDQMKFVFGRALGNRPGHSRNSLVERLSLIAAVEHLTAFLGDWVLNAEELDRADFDPTMLDLLRWHGAEEVEHRAVAYEVMRYFDVRHARRIRTYIAIAPTLVYFWTRGVRYLMDQDPTLTHLPPKKRQAGFRDFRRVTSRGLFPSSMQMLKASLRYFKRDYHPSKEGSTAQAVRYLATSPAARSAAR